MSTKYELRFDGESWSVYGPFNGYEIDYIASGTTMEEALKNAYAQTGTALKFELSRAYE